MKPRRFSAHRKTALFALLGSLVASSALATPSAPAAPPTKTLPQGELAQQITDQALTMLIARGQLPPVVRASLDDALRRSRETFAVTVQGETHPTVKATSYLGALEASFATHAGRFVSTGHTWVYSRVESTAKRMKGLALALFPYDTHRVEYLGVKPGVSVVALPEAGNGAGPTPVFTYAIAHPVERVNVDVDMGNGVPHRYGTAEHEAFNPEGMALAAVEYGTTFAMTQALPVAGLLAQLGVLAGRGGLAFLPLKARLAFAKGEPFHIVTHDYRGLEREKFSGAQGLVKGRPSSSTTWVRFGTGRHVKVTAAQRAQLEASYAARAVAR